MRWWGREGLSLECGREVRAELCGLEKKLGEMGVPGDWVNTWYLCSSSSNNNNSNNKAQGNRLGSSKKVTPRKKAFEMMTGKEK